MSTPIGRITAPQLRNRKTADKVVMVTAYDATFARMIDDAGVDAILVGDSLGMVVQGHDSTLPVTMDEMLYHCRAVVRGSERAHIVGDMPFMSYQSSADDALRNAGRFLKEGGVQSVKLEGGASIAELVSRITQAGIPVMGHVGLQPQSVHAIGGFRAQGKTRDAGDRILADAHAIADAGAYAIVLEGIPAELAERITSEVPVPTIGIGAGPSCDGQVLVCYDLLGLTAELRPKFVKRYDELFARGVTAVESFAREVREGSFPAAEHTLHVKPDAAPTPAAPVAAAESLGYAAPAKRATKR